MSVVTAKGEALLAVQCRLTDRDLTLLGWLADHGLLTTDQIAHALFPSLDFAQRRLLSLYRTGVIDRFRPQRPEGGTHPYHYVLAQLGVDVVAAQRGIDPRLVGVGSHDPDDDRLPRRDQAKRRRWWLTNRARLPHLLAVNQFFVGLAGYARTHPDHALELWWPTSRCMTANAFGSGIYYTTATRAWATTIRADGHGLWTRHTRDPVTGQTWTTRVPFFAEVDLGTEDLARLVDKNTRLRPLRRRHRTGLARPVLAPVPHPRTPLPRPARPAPLPHPDRHRHSRPHHRQRPDTRRRRLTLIDLAATVSGRPVPTTERPPE